MVGVSKPQKNLAINAPSDVSVGVFDNNSNAPSEEKMKVVVRVRPLQAREEAWSNGTEVDANVNLPTTIIIQENEVRWEKNGQMKILKADAVFANGSSQDNVFCSVSESVDALIAGFDCSVFAYGQTGTGKTHTMSGLQRDERKDRDALGLTPTHYGVVPRSIDRLFTEIERRKHGTAGEAFTVYCSFIEIYNEKIFDILSPEMIANGKGSHSPDSKPSAPNNGSQTQRARWNSSVSAKDTKCLQIRQKLDGSVFVDGMTSRTVNSKAELLQAFREGLLHREVRDNLYNQFSSRGHAVFQITLRKTFADAESIKNTVKKTRLSRLFFVDLAGSEKWHVNGSELTDKYASELASINRSLSALTNCVLALTQKERSHVPFRDSVLTRLLQPCLQGSGRTAFIVTISPSKGSLEESFATLRFAERLKAIRCRPVRRSLFSNEMLGEQRLYYERQIQAMRAEVNRLRELLRKASQRPNEAAGGTSRDANAALVEENRRLKELLQQSERSRLVERSERISNKSIKAGGVTVKMSPQQFSARQMLKPTPTSISASARHFHASTDQTVDATEQPTDQLTTLESQLQSKEARLNWMLEAEMEAQNTGTSASTVDTAMGDPNPGRPTVTRSWAVETRLRRQLVAVPPRLRDTHPGPGYAALGERKLNGQSPVDRQEAPPVKAVLPVLVESSPGSAREQVIKHGSTQSASQQPTRRRAPSPPTASHSPPDEVVVGSRRSRANAITRSQPTRQVEAASQSEQVRASSILKLVGSDSGDNTSGKTRQELIEEYKRARRVELEAMMRTMVQK
ncbi:Kinesin-like protein KIF15 [Phytophthora citrophthora]|uniref:Kinesin-like protein n=1 Tax=Phytophthora citrophthora TaxID=4793 RepID=A0AAD9LTB8_9STRA|nr:Kinesin-like protein KIF15 [Phytophthora citrophthora]